MARFSISNPSKRDKGSLKQGISNEAKDIRFFLDQFVTSDIGSNVSALLAKMTGHS